MLLTPVYPLPLPLLQPPLALISLYVDMLCFFLGVRTLSLNDNFLIFYLGCFCPITNVSWCNTTVWNHIAKDITPLIDWGRQVEKGSVRWYALKGWERAIVNQTNTGTVPRSTLGMFPSDGMEHVWDFLSTWIPSWTELISGCCQWGIYCGLG